MPSRLVQLLVKHPCGHTSLQVEPQKPSLHEPSIRQKE